MIAKSEVASELASALKEIGASYAGVAKSVDSLRSEIAGVSEEMMAALAEMSGRISELEGLMSSVLDRLLEMDSRFTEIRDAVGEKIDSIKMPTLSDLFVEAEEPEPEPEESEEPEEPEQAQPDPVVGALAWRLATLLEENGVQVEADKAMRIVSDLIETAEEIAEAERGGVEEYGEREGQPSEESKTA